MVVQFEDVVDVLRALYRDTYEFVFYFDHSSGHDRLRPDGLNHIQMNKGYGGNQPKMRESKIENATYLGPHPSSLRVGDIQYMCFRLGDLGPFWLTPEQREEMKYDHESDEIEKKSIKNLSCIKKSKNAPVYCLHG